jgi:hypothetical protein
MAATVYEKEFEAFVIRLRNSRLNVETQQAIVDNAAHVLTLMFLESKTKDANIKQLEQKVSDLERQNAFFRARLVRMLDVQEAPEYWRD